jgi:hypothetical protein
VLMTAASHLPGGLAAGVCMRRTFAQFPLLQVLIAQLLVSVICHNSTPCSYILGAVKEGWHYSGSRGGTEAMGHPSYWFLQHVPARVSSSMTASAAALPCCPALLAASAAAALWLLGPGPLLFVWWCWEVLRPPSWRKPPGVKGPVQFVINLPSRSLEEG